VRSGSIEGGGEGGRLTRGKPSNLEQEKKERVSHEGGLQGAPGEERLDPYPPERKEVGLLVFLAGARPKKKETQYRGVKRELGTPYRESREALYDPLENREG